MGEGCQEVPKKRAGGPSTRGRGLPARQGAGREIRMTPTVCVFNRTRESFLCLSAVAAGAFPRLPGVSRVGQEARIYEDGPRGWNLAHAIAGYLRRRHAVPSRPGVSGPGKSGDPAGGASGPFADRSRALPYASVLEVRTRTIYSSRTRVGDELLICPPDEVETHWKESAGSKGLDETGGDSVFKRMMGGLSRWLEKKPPRKSVARRDWPNRPYWFTTGMAQCRKAAKSGISVPPGPK